MSPRKGVRDPGTDITEKGWKPDSSDPESGRQESENGIEGQPDFSRIPVVFLLVFRVSSCSVSARLQRPS